MIKKRLASIVLVLALTLATIPIGGCNVQQTAIRAQGVIQAVLNVAKVECPAFPVKDQAACNSFVDLGITLDGQLANCISSASGIMSTSGKFKACFNIFAQGLFSPAELAQLRIMSAGSQSRVQLYVTSIVAGVNIVLAFLTPTITALPPTSEVIEFREKVAAQLPVDIHDRIMAGK